MTPDEFTAAMRAILKLIDHEEEHKAADGLLCQALRELGYGEGVDLFEASTRWYA